MNKVNAVCAHLVCRCVRTALYTVNQKKTWQYIFDYNFG